MTPTKTVAVPARLTSILSFSPAKTIFDVPPATTVALLMLPFTNMLPVLHVHEGARRRHAYLAMGKHDEEDHGCLIASIEAYLSTLVIHLILKLAQSKTGQRL